jgi:ribosomal protein S18 acetylase RimI-like enzyme
MVKLRRAVPADAPSLAVLAERTFRDTFGARNSPENLDQHCEKVFGADIQLREITDRTLVTTVADLDGNLVGFSQLRMGHAHASVMAERPAELNRIYVAAEWHGRGVARDLMQDALDTAADADCDVLWLGVWEHNPKAMAFYRKFGFEIVGSHAFMLGKDRQRDLVMALKLHT